MRDIIADILKEINFIQQKLSRYRFQRLSHFEPFIIFSQKKKKRIIRLNPPIHKNLLSQNKSEFLLALRRICS